MVPKIKSKSFENELKSIGELIQEWGKLDDYKAVIDEEKFTTRADIAAHKALVELISKYSDCSEILSEEDYPESERPDSYWLLDPIDGTASWHEGYDGYVSQLCYINNGSVMYSAVYAPALDQLWTAHRGEGAFLNGRPLTSSDTHKQTSELVLVDNYPAPRHAAGEICKALKIKNYKESGSIGLKCCLVASGEADIFIKDVVVRDWDIAPADLILAECGACMVDLQGRRMSYRESHIKDTGLLVTSNKELAEAVLKAFANSN